MCVCKYIIDFVSIYLSASPIVVIKLEGGTDFDLQVLDKPYEEEKPKESTPYLSPR